MGSQRKKIEYDKAGRQIGFNYQLDRFNISISRKSSKDDCVIFDGPLYRVPAAKLEQIVKTYQKIRKKRA